jgi:predicted transglutaminase-like cysteine proteinase
MSRIRRLVFAASILLTLQPGATSLAAGQAEGSMPASVVPPVNWGAGATQVNLFDHFALRLDTFRAEAAAPKSDRLVAAGIDSAITGALAPAVLRPAGKSRGLFGSVALPFRKLPAAARLRELGVSTPTIAGCKDEGCRARLRLIRGHIAGADGRRDLIDRVNRAVNNLIAYKTDRDGYGTVDHWAGASTTLRRGYADCEDFALLKMALLAENGLVASDMTMVVLRDRRRDVYHSVLAVAHGGETLVLDNLERDVHADTALAHYMPLYSVSDGKSYIHGWRTGGRMATASLKNLSGVAPGEGISPRAATSAR